MVGKVKEHANGRLIQRRRGLADSAAQQANSQERDWEIPVMFTGPDGASVFKVLDVGKYDEKLRWARNPEQNLAAQGSTTRRLVCTMCKTRVE